MASSNAINFFYYTPNLTLAAMSMVTYLLLTIYLLARIYTSKSTSFLYILPIVAFFQFISFLYRISCINSTTLPKYIIMKFVLMIPPYVLPLINYLALGKLIQLSNIQTTHFFLNPTFVTWFFFVISIFSFLVKTIYNDDVPTAGIGFAVVYVMLDLSLYSILSTSFIAIAMYVYQNPDYVVPVKNLPNAKRKLFFAIFTTTALQFIRTIFSSCEYATGLDGAIAATEWTFYIFNIIPTILIFIIYSKFFIGDYFLKDDNSSYQCSRLPTSGYADGDEDADTFPDNRKNIAIFNNVHSVNYSIELEP